MTTQELNQERFCELLTHIKRNGADIEGLIKKLCSSDFFSAPASTRFHNAYEGGLCAHCLNVYDNLVKLVKEKNLEEMIDDESIIICGLLHDLSKMNYYEKTSRNKKIYFPEGTKHDEVGNFEWVAEIGYKTKDNKFIYGNHEETSEFMIRYFIPLRIPESVAILNHHGGCGYDSIKDSVGITNKYNTYPLATLLHVADMLATYVDEAIENAE